MKNQRSDATSGETVPAAGFATTTSSALPAALGRAGWAATSGWMAFAAANMDAVGKSRAILARGLRALGASSFGLTLMSVEQAAAVLQGVPACRSGGDWVAVQGRLVRLNTRSVVDSALLLFQMNIQVIQDAWVPLRRRLEVATGAS